MYTKEIRLGGNIWFTLSFSDGKWCSRISHVSKKGARRTHNKWIGESAEEVEQLAMEYYREQYPTA